MLPPAIPQELAEDFSWWADVHPPAGFEDQIDLILPKRDSWSTTLRMWGQKHRDDAHVIYVDETKSEVEEIAFRIDANAISPELVRRVCILARQLGCVLLTAQYQILLPDESMVMTTIQHSIAKKFVDDPAAALREVGQPEVQQRLQYPMKDDPPRSVD